MTSVRIQAWLDQQDARTTDTIRRVGWTVQAIGYGCCDDPDCDGGEVGDPPFAYTVGLFGLGHPELLILGAPLPTASRLLNTLGAGVRAGRDLVPGELLTFREWPHRVVPEPVPNPGEIVFAANRFYARPDEHSVPVLQLTYDDRAGRFPWDPGYAAPFRQPRPGTFRA